MCLLPRRGRSRLRRILVITAVLGGRWACWTFETCIMAGTFSLSLSILAIYLYDNLPGDSSSLQLSPANYIVQTHLSNLAALRSATVDLTRFGPGSWPLKYFLLSISTWCIWIRLISSIVFTPLGVPFAMNLPLPLRFASVYRSSAQGCVHALVAMLKVAFQSTRPPRCPSCLSFPSFRCQKVPLQHSSSGVR